MMKIHLKNDEAETLASYLVHQIHETKKILLLENSMYNLEKVLVKILPNLQEGFRKTCLEGIIRSEGMQKVILKKTIPEMIPEKRSLEEKLLMRIDDSNSPELSIKTKNVLMLSNFRTWANVCKNKESDMLKCKGLGRKSLLELREVLSKMGLHYEMDCRHLAK